MGNVTFGKRVNDPSDPVIRCQECKKLMPDEREPIALANDPEFKRLRLFQICVQCACKNYQPGYWAWIRKKKWEIVEYQDAWNKGKVEKYWRKKGKL